MWFPQSVPTGEKRQEFKINKCRGCLVIFFLLMLEIDEGDKHPKMRAQEIFPALFPSAACVVPAWAPPPAPDENLTVRVRISLGGATRVPLHVPFLRIKHHFWRAAEHWSLNPSFPLCVSHISWIWASWRLSSPSPS